MMPTHIRSLNAATDSAAKLAERLRNLHDDLRVMVAPEYRDATAALAIALQGVSAAYETLRNIKAGS